MSMLLFEVGWLFLAVCFRDSGGSLCRVYTEIFFSINSLFGEASTLVAAANITALFGWSSIDSETDCLILSQLVLDRSRQLGPLLERLVKKLWEFL